MRSLLAFVPLAVNVGADTVTQTSLLHAATEWATLMAYCASILLSLVLIWKNKGKSGMLWKRLFEVLKSLKSGK